MHDQTRPLGGEALLQPAFVRDLFQAAKAEGMHTCLDTNGYVSCWGRNEYGEVNDVPLTQFDSIYAGNHSTVDQDVRAGDKFGIVACQEKCGPSDVLGRSAAAGQRRLEWACLAHLSETNNSPAVALRAHRGAYGEQIPVHVASRQQATEILEI